MITQIATVEDLTDIWLEVFQDKTDKVSKISPNSALFAIANACAKLGQKSLKEIAVLESHLFPESAYAGYLDQIAVRSGVAPRFGATPSSTYLLVSGTPGTVYQTGVHTFTGNHGIIFGLINNFTIPAVGYGYVKIQSLSEGLSVNVEPNSITRVSPVPAGHSYCINEYQATGGRDFETDDVFRKRIQDGPNILATGTIARLEQIFGLINPSVLKVLHQGFSSTGEVILGIVTVNGNDLTVNELNDLVVQSDKYLSLSELRFEGSNYYGIILQNVQYYPIDISFRVDLFPAFNIDTLRKEIQIAMQKYFDFRFWNIDQKVEWDDLLAIVKNTRGVRYVYDNTFFPNNDFFIPINQLPRIRGFRMLDVNGNIIIDLQGNLNPVFYPNVLDFGLQATVFPSITV